MQSRVSSSTLRSWIVMCSLLAHDSRSWHRVLAFITICFNVACSNIHHRDFELRSKAVHLRLRHGVLHRRFTVLELCNPSVSHENSLHRFNDSTLQSSNPAVEKWRRKIDPSRTGSLLWWWIGMNSFLLLILQFSFSSSVLLGTASV